MELYWFLPAKKGVRRIDGLNGILFGDLVFACNCTFGRIDEIGDAESFKQVRVWT